MFRCGFTSPQKCGQGSTCPSACCSRLATARPSLSLGRQNRDDAMMAALSKAINEVLIPAGFSKDGDVWRRASVPWLDVMELQKSKSGQAATLNCGIHHPEIYEKCWGRPGKAPISYSNCIVRTRLSELVLGRDEWWKLEDPVAIEAAAEMTKSHGLPFVERMHSLERVHLSISN